MATIVDRAYLEINGEVIECASLDESIDVDSKPVEVMNRANRAIGHSQGVPKFKLTAELAMDADSDVDFEQMMLDKDLFSAGVEYEGGGFKTYLDCVISKVDVKSRANEHVTYSLDINALDLVKG